MLLDLNVLKFYEGDDGAGDGAGNEPKEPIKETPKVEPVKKTEDTPEDLLSFKKEEFEQRLNNKFAEGAKKAEKNLIEEFGFESKEDFDKAIKAAKELEEKYNKANSELSQLKAEKLVISAGGSAGIAENVIALVKGKGQELTEENIKSALEVFAPNQAKGFGTKPTTRNDGKNKKTPPRVF
jgi:hypothetical protein